MTTEEALAIQNRLESEGFDLSFWYGVHCDKCCGVYPEFKASTDFKAEVWFECPVCHRKSIKCIMPWIAQKEWNSMHYTDDNCQFSLF